MGAVARQEQELYDLVWNSISTYGEFSPGEVNIKLFFDMAGVNPTHPGSVLDAGCGNGKASVLFNQLGFSVMACDIVDARSDEMKALPIKFFQACLWKDYSLPFILGNKVMYGFCCDVLEHIPPQMTMLVIARMLRLVKKGLFLSICTVPDTNGAWVGQPLHLTVQPFTWWRDQLSELGRVVECRDLLTSGVYYVVPDAE